MKLLKQSLILALVLFATTFVQAESVVSAHSLYLAGKVKEAKSAFEYELTKSQESSNLSTQWQGLMSIAWFEIMTGHFSKAIQHSNSALEVAKRANNQFMLGRSFCWLGWAYSGLGLYEAAMEFFSTAAEIGAPKGEIKIVSVWGFATQEIGGLYFKMGDLKSACAALSKTINFAREHRIAIGIAEGGAHLAELALSEGNITEALSLAKEAEAASIECNCSHYNTARAKLVLARVYWAAIKNDPSKKDQALQAIHSTLQFAKDTGSRSVVAESKILLSRALPTEKFEERFKLVSEASALAHMMKSEFSGSAAAELGALYLEKNELQLAEFYLKYGIELNSKMLRQIDAAFILADQAALEGALGETKAALATLTAAADQAMAQGLLPRVADAQEQLSLVYEKYHYDSLALKWAMLALESVSKLLAKDSPKNIKQQLNLRQLVLQERIVELSLSLLPTNNIELEF